MTSTEQKPTGRTAGPAGWTKALARKGAGLGFAAALACSLSGCGADYASSDPAFPGDFQARHPIALASAPTSVDVYSVGGALDSRTIANLRAFAERYHRFGSSEILILTQAATAPRRKLLTRFARLYSARDCAAGSASPLTSLPNATVRHRYASRSWASRRLSERLADYGRRTSPPARRSKVGRMSRTPISDARPNPSSRLRSTIPAISSSRGRWPRRMSPCARGRLRPSARVKIQ